LQLDIEGGEYPSLLSTPPCILDKFRLVVIELHDIHHISSSAGHVPLRGVNPEARLP
jgi:hypothetical protein